MIRNFTAPAVLLLTVACATAPMTSSSGVVAPATVAAAPAATEYILLSSPTSVRNWQATNPETSLHIRGVMTNRGFVPSGEVQGRGKLCTDGKDWLSLSDLKIHKASEGATPTAPYLLGCANGNSFIPASREVVAQ